MKDMGYVTGTVAQAKEVIVNKDTVYVHTDIQKVEGVDEFENPFEYYTYHEIQYEKDEYIQMLAEQNAKAISLLNALLGVDE